MNFFKLFILLTPLIIFVGCSKDKEECQQADWVGNYSGTITCDGGTVEDLTVTITASGSDKIVLVCNGTETSPIKANGCQIILSSTQEGETISSNGAMLNGDNLSFAKTITNSTNGDTLSCFANATRD